MRDVFTGQAKVTLICCSCPIQNFQGLLTLVRVLSNHVQGEGYMDDHIDYYLNELNRTGVTRELFWKEYRQVEPEGYSYSQFCYLLSRHRYKKSPVYHNTYSPGELLEFDFAGEKMSYN